MPTYFFDIDDGDRRIKDGVGRELPNDERARFCGVDPRQSGFLQRQPPREVCVVVRNAQGRLVSRSTVFPPGQATSTEAPPEWMERFRPAWNSSGSCMRGI